MTDSGQPTSRPLVGILMGSKSDWETMRHAAEMLTRLQVPHEARVLSAHRTFKPSSVTDPRPASQSGWHAFRGNHRGFSAAYAEQVLCRKLARASQVSG